MGEGGHRGAAGKGTRNNVVPRQAGIHKGAGWELTEGGYNYEVLLGAVCGGIGEEEATHIRRQIRGVCVQVGAGPGLRLRRDHGLQVGCFPARCKKGKLRPHSCCLCCTRFSCWAWRCGGIMQRWEAQQLVIMAFSPKSRSHCLCSRYFVSVSAPWRLCLPLPLL